MHAVDFQRKWRDAQVKERSGAQEHFLDIPSGAVVVPFSVLRQRRVLLSADDALDIAEQWAEEYYGGDEVTWSPSAESRRYLVGRIHENSTRAPVTCVITVEEHEEMAESRRRL